MFAFQMDLIDPPGATKGDRYKGIAQENAHFYLTLPEYRQIHRYDESFRQTGSFDVCRAYTSLCYDAAEGCFWALAQDLPDHIFKLDKSFHETASIEVKGAQRCPVQITGVSCGATNRELFLAVDGCVAAIDKTGRGGYHVLQGASACQRYESVQSFCDGYMAGVRWPLDDGLAVYPGCGGAQLQCHLPNGYRMEDMTAGERPCGAGNLPVVYLLATKENGSVCILRCSLLRTEKCDSCDDLRKKPCSDRHPCKKKDGKASVTDIIESVALTQTAISHILNAEGETLQKLLGIAHQTCELIEGNEAVNQTLTHVIYLEQVLYGKLELMKEICPDICKKSGCNAGCDCCGGC